jgi:hypothetical protein
LFKNIYKYPACYAGTCTGIIIHGELLTFSKQHGLAYLPVTSGGSLMLPSAIHASTVIRYIHFVPPRLGSPQEVRLFFTRLYNEDLLHPLLWIFQYFSEIHKNNQHLLYTGVKHEKSAFV